jgi:hypothetical protein
MSLDAYKRDFRSLRLCELHPSVNDVSFDLLYQREHSYSNLSIHKLYPYCGVQFVVDNFFWCELYPGHIVPS